MVGNAKIRNADLRIPVQPELVRLVQMFDCADTGLSVDKLIANLLMLALPLQIKASMSDQSSRNDRSEHPLRRSAQPRHSYKIFKTCSMCTALGYKN